MILLIDTSAAFCSVAITDLQGNVLNSLSENTENTHAEKLPVMVNQVLENLNIHAKDLLAIAVAKGPGSYTGLRIGTSLAKGLCFALNVPLMGLNSFLGMAKYASINSIGDLFISNLDARRDEIYVEIYNAKLVVEMTLSSMILEPDSFITFGERKIVFVGNAVNKIENLCQFLNSPKYLECSPKAEYLSAEAVDKYKKKQFEDLAYYEPYYLKEFMAGTPKKFSL